MLKTLLSDKPLVAAVVAVIAALAATVCHIVGLPVPSTSSIDWVAGLVVSAYIGGEAHKTATTTKTAAGAPGTTVTAPPAPAAGPTVTQVLATALSEAAKALEPPTSKAG